MLEASGIHKYYGQLHVLKGVDLVIVPGELVTLVGASGAGKSTLLQILGTLDTADQGQVRFEGVSLTSATEAQRTAFRNQKVGFVFQFHHLLPEFSALENIAMPAYIAGVDRKTADARATELLAYLGLSDRASHRPSQLSGGESQRIAVARALMNKPRLILADEPTGNLDTSNSSKLFELFQQLAKDLGVGFLITTHNEALARSADRCLRMVDGLIMA
jgi:lipoprotein-releasing system ATP-binding protein